MNSHQRANPFPNVPQVAARTAYEEWQGDQASILDVREPEEWQMGHIDGSQWIPMGQLTHRWTELATHRKWIVVCRSGSRSNYVAAALREAGIEACNLEGGMLEWQAEKLPITAPGLVE